MLKKAFVRGEEIPRAAIEFEFDRLVKFYAEHGMSKDELRKNVEKLLMRAQEQVVGAKLLMLRAAELGLAGGDGPDKLVAQALSGVPDPEEAEIEAFYKSARDEFGGKEFMEVHDKIRDYLRHAARGRALEVFIAELKERYGVEYKDA